MAIEFYIQIETPTGIILGAGPIVSSSGWSSTTRMDMGGQFNFSMPASDPKAALITEKRRVRAYSMRNGVWTEEGDGIIDLIDTTVADDGTVELAISGNDGSSELDGFIVPTTISLSNGSTPQLPTYALGLLQTYSTLAASAVWTFNTTDTGSNTLYGAFYDESVLRAIIVIAQKAGCHWRYEGSRTIKFFTSFTASGLRAIEQNGNLSAETCAITSIKKTIDTHELTVGVFARGAGQGLARFGFNATTRSAPTGYYAVPNISYLTNLDALALYGTIDRPVDFKDIGPISNTDADLTAAANALFDSAALYLRRYSQRVTTYTLAVEGCSARLKPGQTIRVDYHDPVAGIDINEDLYIIEATTSIGDDGVNTTGLVVSTLDAWPTSDVSVLVDRLAEGKVYQANPQLNANSYTTGYTKNLDDTVTASFRFRFGSEVTQLQQVLFEFQLLPFESTVKTVALQSMTGGSGQLLTDGATGNTGNPSNDSSGAPSVAGSGTPSTDVSGAPSVNTSGAPSTDISGAASGGTGASSGATGAATGGTGASSGATDAAAGDTGTSSGNTGTSSGNTGASSGSTGGPSGGDTGAGGKHMHNITVQAVGSTAGLAQVYVSATPQYFAAVMGSDVDVPTISSGNHNHSLGGHTHTLNSHTHTLNGHTHSLGGHTHTLGSHTHDLSSHTHGLGSHTHDLGSHTHSLNSHTHTLGGHTHSLGGHTHSLGGHTHSLNNHTHSLGNHTHTLTPTISTVYGIFREVVGNTYAVTDLEYRVNSNSWIALSTSTSLGGGWYRLDVTSLVYDSVSFRPLAESNVIEVRKAAAAAASKTVTIDALLSVRNIIQAIAYIV